MAGQNRVEYNNQAAVLKKLCRAVRILRSSLWHPGQNLR